MRRVCTRTLVGLVGVAVASAGTALPAQASDGATLSTRGPASADVDSTYLAGYTTTTGGVVSATTRSFTVPSYTCGARTTGIAVGILDEPVEGLPYALADVFLACVDGEPYIITDVLVADAFDQGTAEPGDELTFSITTEGDQITATTTNLTDPAGSATVTSAGVLAPSLHFGAGPLYADGAMLAVPEIDAITLKRNRTSEGRLSKSGTVRIHRVDGDTTEIKAGRLRNATFKLLA